MPLSDVVAARGVTGCCPAVAGVLSRRCSGRRPDVPDILIARFRLVLDASVRRAARALIRASV